MNDPKMAFKRRQILHGTLAAGTLLGTSACTAASARLASAAMLNPVPPIRPLRISADRIVELKTCLRPFRAVGPKLDAEQVGDHLIVYNYGHGGSGWSLSWGSAEIAVHKAMSVLPEEIAVIGCGIIGLTSALTAQRAGAKVTIYTRDLLPQTRSSRAYGAWTPDSRIALTKPAGPAFAATWEQMARRSYATFRSFMGMAGKPVDVGDNYRLSDEPFKSRAHESDPAITASFETTGMPQQSSEFATYMSRIRDITPGKEDVDPDSTPFRPRFIERQSRMFFNFSSLGELLMQQFQAAGGKIVIRTIRSREDLTTLAQKVVIVSPGYAASDLLRDKSLIPVRGQTAWLLPDPDMNYGFGYKDIGVLSKADGLIVQNNSGGLGEMLGVGDSNEVPILEQTLQAIETLKTVYRSPRA